MNDQKRQASNNTPPIIPIGGRRGPGGGGPMAARMNAEKPKNTKRTAVRLLRYIGKSGFLLAALLCIMLAVTAADLMGPFFQASAIDTIIFDEASETWHVDWQAMTGFLVGMGAVALLSATLSLFQGILSARLAQHTVRVMRNDLFRNALFLFRPLYLALQSQSE